MSCTKAVLLAAFTLVSAISCKPKGSTAPDSSVGKPATDGGTGGRPAPIADAGMDNRAPPPIRDGGTDGTPPVADAGMDSAPPPTTDAGMDGAPPPIKDAGMDGSSATPEAGVGPPPPVDAAAPYPDAGRDATTSPPGMDAAPPPPPRVTRRIAVIGDFGGDTTEEGQVAKLVKGWNPDAVITVGDNNYSEGTRAAWDATVGKHYGSFIGSYKGSHGPGAVTNKFWPALGDHDWQDAGLDSWLDYFTLPGNERYYDVDLGPVRLYAVNSNSEEPDGYKPGSKQGQWLQGRLAASKACFDLVYFHHPPYSSGHHGSRTHMDWPFVAWGADATFAGHDHNYERLEVAGIPYFVVGTGGLGLREVAADPLPETKFRQDQKHGALLVIASSDGTITYEFWSIDGVKLDALTRKKAC